jgi:hypothetical protein
MNVLRRLSQRISRKSAPSCENAASLRNEARIALDGNRVEDAFRLLIRAKALKQRTTNLDLIRAKCFLRMNQPDAAKQALLEELAHFPTNEDARRLLKQISGDKTYKYDNEEFNMLMGQISDYTMLSQERLYSLFTLARDACLSGLDGNFVECGVARGGSSALLAAIIKKYSNTPRLLFACDTFEGMPAPTADDSHGGIAADDTGWGTGTCAGPVESLMEACGKLGVADLVVPVKGYFQETLPESKRRIGKIALLHMDGDWYESTKAILDNLYDSVVDQGFIQVDDYGHWAGCRKAVDEFQNKENVKFDIHKIDGTGVWFTKTDRPRVES